jgi:hypothetical protein
MKLGQSLCCIVKTKNHPSKNFIGAISIALCAISMKRLEIFWKKNFYAATLPPTLPVRQGTPTHTAGSTG